MLSRVSCSLGCGLSDCVKRDAAQEYGNPRNRCREIAVDGSLHSPSASVSVSVSASVSVSGAQSPCCGASVLLATVLASVLAREPGIRKPALIKSSTDYLAAIPAMTSTIRGACGLNTATDANIHGQGFMASATSAPRLLCPAIGHVARCADIASATAS
jgi:hypothetical protein